MSHQQPPDSDERRAHFRVPDTLLLDYEPIDEHEMALRREEMAGRWPNAFMLASRLHEIREGATVLRRHARQESAVFSKLVDTLDQSIDLLAETLAVQAFGNRVAKVTDVNIGAGGMDFISSDGALPPGSILDLRMLFHSTGAGLRMFGRVRRCDRVATGGHRLGIEFEFAREHDRELLVHLMLRREAQLLREERGD